MSLNQGSISSRHIGVWIYLGNKLSDAFECSFGVRQGESLSMFLNDSEAVFMNKGLSGIDANFFKICLILYADDIVVFAESKDELQRSLDALIEYCNRWKLVVNTRKN